LGEFVDSIVVMNDGRIIMKGSYDEVKNNPKLKEVYFG
jgi:ABC-type branched-subunit amino acid transport system ATPase component